MAKKMYKPKRGAKRTASKKRKAASRAATKSLLGRSNEDMYKGMPLVRASRMYNNPLNAIPAYRDVVFKYCHDKILNSFATTQQLGNEQSFALNDLFDPDITGAGHQPYGYDQIAQLYKKYRVFQCDVLLFFYFPTASTQSVCVQPANSQDTLTLTGAFIDAASERNGVSWSPIDPNSHTTIHYEDSIKIWQLEGMDYKQWLADDAFCANIGASPAALSKIRCALADANAPTSATAITVRAELIYHVRLYEPQTQTQS